MTVPDDCTTCGDCCHSWERGYIQVFAVDEARMDEAALALTETDGDRRIMRFEEGRCLALDLREGRFRCRIYPMRPDACRWLERGSGICRSMIAARALVRAPK